MLRPQSGPAQQIITQEFTLSPNTTFYEYRDIYGNLCQRVSSPIGNFKIQSSAIVETSDTIDVNFAGQALSIEQLPDFALIYLLPSRYCESDRFLLMADEITQTFRQVTKKSMQYAIGYEAM